MCLKKNPAMVKEICNNSKITFCVVFMLTEMSVEAKTNSRHVRTHHRYHTQLVLTDTLSTVG